MLSQSPFLLASLCSAPLLHFLQLQPRFWITRLPYWLPAAVEDLFRKGKSSSPRFRRGYRERERAPALSFRPLLADSPLDLSHHRLPFVRRATRLIVSFRQIYFGSHLSLFSAIYYHLPLCFSSSDHVASLLASHPSFFPFVAHSSLSFSAWE